jgi:glucokinase
MATGLAFGKVGMPNYMSEKAVIGIDIGGTKTLCALITERYALVEVVKFKTGAHKGKASFVAKLGSAIQTLLKRAKAEKLKPIGFGIACAGLVDAERSAIVFCPNIIWLENYPIGSVLRRKFGLPSVIGNDVQLALCGEHRLGVAADCKNVLGVFFGTGVGGAAIINGKLYEGSAGIGGQVGAILAHPAPGTEAANGHGTLDSLASKAAIAGTAISMGIKQWAPHLFEEVNTDISKVTWGALSRARKAGDKHIDELICSRLRLAGMTLSSVVNFMNPEMLVLGGGLTAELPRLAVREIDAGIREYLVPEVSRKLKIKAAKLGNRAGVFGGATLAFKELS